MVLINNDQYSSIIVYNINQNYSKDKEYNFENEVKAISLSKNSNYFSVYEQ